VCFSDSVSGEGNFRRSCQVVAAKEFLLAPNARSVEIAVKGANPKRASERFLIFLTQTGEKRRLYHWNGEIRSNQQNYETEI
jgi:hypothetical protein